MKNPDCNAALKRIVPRLKLNELRDLVDGTPFIGDLQKEFYYTMLSERKEKIPDYSLQRMKAREKKHDRDAR